LEFYGYPKKKTYEALLVLLYNDIIARDDFGCLMAYSPSEVKVDDNNYCLLQNDNTRAKIFFNKYKTSGSYGEQVVELSTDTTKLIRELHPNTKHKHLFPNVKGNKLGAFTRATFRNVPFLKDEKIDIKYLRHSIISSALLDIKQSDPKYPQKVEALANKSFHKVSTQDTYISPLKNEKGEPLNINTDVLKEYDTITKVITEQDDEGSNADEEEEIVSKRKSKKRI
jgi:hypothetical protein